MKKIDLNIDIGEGFGLENDIIPLIKSCNISCGSHAGNDMEIKKCIALATKYKVKIGAHPSYPDKENFGRVSMKIDRKELAANLEYQLTHFIKFLNHPDDLNHVKPHGALYNDCLKNEILVDTFLKVILKCCPNTTIFTMYKSELWKQAKKKGISVWCEAFLDRIYTKDGKLQDRGEVGAVISDVNKIFMQLESMINKKKVKTNEGKWISIKADTYCLHGDHPNVIKNLQKLIELCNNKITYEL